MVIVRITTFTLREKCPYTEFFSGPYFPVFGLNTGRHRPEKTRYLDSLCNLVVRLSHRPLSSWKGERTLNFLFREQ